MLKIFLFLLNVMSIFSEVRALNLGHKRMVWVRHGTTDWNWRMMGEGVKDLPINEEGVEYIRRVSRVLIDSNIEPKLIFCSPLLRCLNTAEIIQREYEKAKGIHLKVVIEKALSGPNYGYWDTKENSQVQQLVKRIEKMDLTEADSKRMLTEKMRQIPIRGREEVQDFRQRVFQAAVNAQKQSDGDILLVSHGSSSEEFINAINKRNQIPSVYWNKFNREPIVVYGEDLNVFLMEVGIDIK